MAITFKIEGAKEVSRQFRKLQIISPQMAAKEVARAAVNIQAKAKKRAPVAKVHGGTLRSSIKLKKVHSFGLVWHVFTKVKYAPYQEFGTRFIKAKLFLTTAFESELPIFKARIAKAISRASKSSF